SLETPMTYDFANKFDADMKAIGNRVCIGIDPPATPKQLASVPFFVEEWNKSPAIFVNRFSTVALKAAHKKVAGVKVQSAFFEAHGAEGFAVLKKLAQQIKDQAMTFILDVKRGDISSTMAAYGKAGYDELKADAMTINTYMG